MDLNTTSNVRFWFEGAKFTMAPNTSLSHHKSWQHDEGFSYEAFTLHASQYGVITCDLASGGTDCDGRVDNYTDLILIDGKFQVLDHTINDVYAQLANY